MCDLQQFDSFDQQDAQELLSFLIDGLHEDLNSVKKKPNTQLTDEEEAELERMPSLLAAEREWKRALLRDDSIITHLFAGQERSRLTVSSLQTL